MGCASQNIAITACSVVGGAAIQPTGATRIIVSGNNITLSAQVPAVAMRGNSDNWHVVDNHFAGGSGLILAGVGSRILNNTEYNSVGTISNPWPPTGADLINNVTGGKAKPQSGTVYTVRHTPKTIVITGGDISTIAIDGVDTESKNGSFKLGVGETIAIHYGSSAPTTLVFAE